MSWNDTEPMSTVMRKRGSQVRLSILVSAGLAAGCMPAPEAVETTEPAGIQVSRENVIEVEPGDIVVGPLVSGELRAQRQATVRTELGGSVLEAPLQEGDSVRAGAIVARIDARSLDDSRRSAESIVRSAEFGLRSAEAQLTLVRREFERTEELVTGGAVAERDLDVARQSVTNAEAQVSVAEAQLADALARLVTAEEQLGDAVLRAPIDGIVAEKAANVGDVVSPGTAVVTIIDPSTMQLEASVPSERLSEIAVGMPVRFQVRGYDDAFEGRIVRISPEVDPVTRQVGIFVSIPNDGTQLVAGLYAEGRVINQVASGLVVPENAVNLTGDEPWVLRARDGRTERVPVVIGLRDSLTEQLQLTSGVEAGDLLLRGAAQGIAPGTAVRVDVAR